MVFCLKYAHSSRSKECTWPTIGETHLIFRIEWWGRNWICIQVLTKDWNALKDNHFLLCKTPIHYGFPFFSLQLKGSLDILLKAVIFIWVKSDHYLKYFQKFIITYIYFRYQCSKEVEQSYQRREELEEVPH